MGPLFNNTIKNCYWQNKKLKCSSIFTPILVGEGQCFAFNALNPKDIFTEEMAPEMMSMETSPRLSHWDLEKGYDDGVHEDEYPVRLFNAKYAAGLNVYLSLFERDVEHICRGSVQVWLNQKVYDFMYDRRHKDMLI